MLSFMPINSFVLLIVASKCLGYEDVEKLCDHGYKISLFRRDAVDNEAARLTFECSALKPSLDSLEVGGFGTMTWT